jgi:hypothetical protein
MNIFGVPQVFLALTLLNFLKTHEKVKIPLSAHSNPSLLPWDMKTVIRQSARAVVSELMNFSMSSLVAFFVLSS